MRIKSITDWCLQWIFQFFLACCDTIIEQKAQFSNHCDKFLNLQLIFLQSHMHFSLLSYFVHYVYLEIPNNSICFWVSSPFKQKCFLPPYFVVVTCPTPESNHRLCSYGACTVTFWLTRAFKATANEIKVWMFVCFFRRLHSRGSVCLRITVETIRCALSCERRLLR